MSRDADGHRTYTIKHLVQGSTLDGPANILTTPGLPTPGSHWIVDNDIDLWAFCRWDAVVRPQVENEPNEFWEVEQTFSTKPPDTRSCREFQVEDPLLEPPKISGSFAKYNEEATHDRFGRLLTNSSYEQLRGPKVEFDKGRATIRIQQNVGTALQGYQLPAQMLDCVNSSPLWGLPARCIKLSSAPWELHFVGNCDYFYSRTLEFDVAVRRSPITGEYVSGFDRDITDEGTKALNGHWDFLSGAWILDDIGGGAPNQFDPSHFSLVKDRQGENMAVRLDGTGKPAGAVLTGTSFTIVGETEIDNTAIQSLSVVLTPPPEPSRLIIRITDADGSIEAGSVVITGTDANGFTITEEIDISMFATAGVSPADLMTQKAFKTVTGASLFTVSGAGPGSLDTITILTPDRRAREAILHVEYYESAEFLLLGVPLLF